MRGAVTAQAKKCVHGISASTATPTHAALAMPVRVSFFGGIRDQVSRLASMDSVLTGSVMRVA